MKRLIFICFLLFSSISIYTFGQVNLTQYASDDLFKAKPVIAPKPGQALKTEKTETSFYEEEIKEGLDYWSKGQMDDAIAHFEVMTQVYSQQAYLYYLLGTVLYEEQRYDEAKVALKKSQEINPLMLEAKYILGLIQIDQNDLITARETMDILISVPLYAAYGYYGMAMITSLEKDVYKTKRMYEKCLKADSTFKEAYIPLTSIDLYLTGGVKRSLKRMNQAVRVAPDYQQARMVRAMLSVYQSGNTEQFAKDINILIEQAPDNFHYYFMKAYLEIELKNYRSAVEHLRYAYNLEIDTTNAGEYQFSTKLKRDKSLQSALNYYHKNFDGIAPTQQENIDKGICAYAGGDHHQALIYYETAAHADKNPVVDYLKAVFYEAKWGKESSVLECYNNVIAQDSTCFMAYSRRGDLLMGQKEFESAYQDYIRMTQLKPDAKEGYKKKGTLLITVGNPLKAYGEFTKAIVRDSSDSDLFFNRGMAAFQSRYFDESIKDVHRVIKKNNQDGEAYYLQSLNYLYKEDTLLAIALLDSASRLKKYKETYHKELLNLALKTKQTDNARHAYDRLVKYFSWNTDYLFEKAKFYYELKEYEQALIDFSKLIKRKKKHEAGLFFLGKTQIALGDRKSGERSIEKAKKLGYH